MGATKSCPISVYVKNVNNPEGLITPKILQDIVDVFHDCNVANWRSSCLQTDGRAHCINPFMLENMFPTNKYEGQTSMNLNGECGNCDNDITYDGDGQWPIVNCRWVGEDSEWPGHEEMSEDEFVERMGSGCRTSESYTELLCSNSDNGFNDDDGVCRHYSRSEYLTFAEAYSVNAENFEGMFGETPAYTRQDRHGFAILAVATARDVQRQQQEDPKSDDDTERTNAVLARAEAALACTQMWENVNDGGAVDLAACSCVDSENAVYKSKTCAWITKTNDPSKMEKKCNKSSDSFLHIGKKVYDLCPSTCSKVDLGPCHVLN